MKRAALALGLLTACAHVEVRPAPPMAVPGGRLWVEGESGVDRGDLASLVATAAEALPEIARWGGLRAATRIIVVPDHAALEDRAHHRGYGWLRAWARYDVVYVQSPSSWGFFHFRPSRDELRTLLTHELTHCAMYQAVSDGLGWDRLQIPLWFREGMASWTAQEEAKRLSLAELRDFCRKHPSVDPLRQADVLVQQDDKLVYSAAHWAFDALMPRGPADVHALLLDLRAGQTFEGAFVSAYGETVGAYEDALLGSWRGTPL